MKNLIWRLSIIAWALLIVILYLFVFPVKWIITGRFRFRSNEAKWIYKWSNKIFNQ